MSTALSAGRLLPYRGSNLQPRACGRRDEHPVPVPCLSPRFFGLRMPQDKGELLPNPIQTAVIIDVAISAFVSVSLSWGNSPSCFI